MQLPPSSSSSSADAAGGTAPSTNDVPLHLQQQQRQPQYQQDLQQQQQFGADGKEKKKPLEIIESLLQTLGLTTVIQLQKPTAECPDTSPSTTVADETMEKEKEQTKGKVLIGTLAGFTDTTITLFNAAPYNPETEEIDVSTFADLSKPAAEPAAAQHKSFIRHYTLDIKSIKKFLNAPRRKSVTGIGLRQRSSVEMRRADAVNALNQTLKDAVDTSLTKKGTRTDNNTNDMGPLKRLEHVRNRKMSPKPLHATDEKISFDRLQKQLQEEIESAAEFWIRMQTAKFIVRYSEPTTEAELKLQAEEKRARNKKAQEQKKAAKKKEASDSKPEKDERDTNIALYLEDIDAKKLLIRDELNVLDENRSKRARRVVLWATTPLSDIKNHYYAHDSTSSRSYWGLAPVKLVGDKNRQPEPPVVSPNPLNECLSVDDFVAPEPVGGDDNSYLMGPSIDDGVYLGTAEGGTAPLHTFLHKQLYEAKQNPFALAVPARIGDVDGSRDELPLMAALQCRIDTLTRKEARASVGEALMWLSSQDETTHKTSIVSHAVNVRTRLMKRLYVGNLFLALLLIALGFVICGAGLLAVLGAHSTLVFGYAMVMWEFAIPAGLVCVLYGIAGACTSNPWKFDGPVVRFHLVGFEVLVHIFLLVLLVLSILPVADKGLGRHGVTSPKEYFNKEAALVGSEQKTRLCDWMTRSPRCTGYEEPCITNAFVGFDFVGLQTRELGNSAFGRTALTSARRLTDLTTTRRQSIERPINTEYAYSQFALDFKLHDWISWSRFYNSTSKEWDENMTTSLKSDIALNCGIQPDCVLLDSLSTRVGRLQVYARIVLWKDSFVGEGPGGIPGHILNRGQKGILAQTPELNKIIFPELDERVVVTFYNIDEKDVPLAPAVQRSNATSDNKVDITGTVVQPINTEYAYSQFALDFKLHDWISWSRFYNSTSKEWDENMTTSLKADIALNCQIQPDSVLFDDLSIQVGRLQVFARIVLWKDGFVGDDPNERTDFILGLDKNGILAQTPELSKIIFPDQGERVVVTYYNIDESDVPVAPTMQPPNITSGNTSTGGNIDITGTVIQPINTEYAYSQFALDFKLHDWIVWPRFYNSTRNGWDQNMTSSLKSDIALNCGLQSGNVLLDDLSIQVGRLQVFARIVLWKDGFLSDPNGKTARIRSLGKSGILARTPELNKIIFPDQGERVVVTYYNLEFSDVPLAPPAPTPNISSDSVTVTGSVVPNINAETAFVVYSFLFKLHERTPWMQFARGNIWETDFVWALKTDMASNLNVTNQSIIIDSLEVIVGRLSVNARVVLWKDDFTGRESDVDTLRPSIVEAGDDGNILLAQPTALNQIINQSAGQSILVTFSRVEERALASTKAIPAGCLHDATDYASVCKIDDTWLAQYAAASDPPQTCGAPFEKQIATHAAVFIALALVTMIVLIVRRVYSECMTHRADSFLMTDVDAGNAAAESNVVADVDRNEIRVVEIDINDATDEVSGAEPEEQPDGSDDDGSHTNANHHPNATPTHDDNDINTNTITVRSAPSSSPTSSTST